MRKNHSKIVCIKLVHLPYLYIYIYMMHGHTYINRGILVRLRSTDLLQQIMWQPSKLLTYGKHILSTTGYSLNPKFRITL